MTWHQWHQTAPISNRIGLSSLFARSKASGPHSYQSTGWCIAERRDGLAARARRTSDLSFTEFLYPFENPLNNPEGPELKINISIGWGVGGRYPRGRSACALKIPR